MSNSKSLSAKQPMTSTPKAPTAGPSSGARTSATRTSVVDSPQGPDITQPRMSGRSMLDSSNTKTKKAEQDRKR